MPVSILVFVELALDAFPACESVALIQVSILVFVELALDVHSRGTAKVTRRGFQSLFSWNLLLMGIVAFVAPRGD